MSISFKGYGENVLTFQASLTNVGVPVIINGNYMVSSAPAEKDFVGITCSADGKYTGVIMNGYVEVPYTGGAPAFGYVNLVANGSGGVKVPASATSSNHIVRVIKVDTSNNIVGFIL